MTQVSNLDNVNIDITALSIKHYKIRENFLSQKFMLCELQFYSVICNKIKMKIVPSSTQFLP